MARKQFVSKFADEAALIEYATVLKFEEQNKHYGQKIKTVFYCKTPKMDKELMCVAWGETYISVGDVVNIKGRMKDDVFLVWGMMIIKKKEAEV